MLVEPHTDFSAHERVRKTTWPLHKQLDQLPVLKKLVQPDCQLEDYQRFLAGMATFYGHYQPQVFAGLGELAPSDLDQRDKLAALQEDLAVLDMEPDTSAMPLTVEDDYASKPAAALGALYVMEGSTQGGQLLQKKMLERFGRTDILHFFTVYGERNARLWQSFLQHFNKVLADEAQAESAADGAAHLYKVLIQLFDKPA